MHNVFRNEKLDPLKFEGQNFIAYKGKCPINVKTDGLILKLYKHFRKAVDNPIELSYNNKSAGQFISTWNVEKNLHEWRELQPFVQWIESQFENHKITEMWANVTEPNGYLKNHNHLGHKFAGTLYLEAKENCGDIIMHNFCKGRIREGDVIIFDGGITHKTQVNNSGHDRIVIAFTLDEI